MDLEILIKQGIGGVRFGMTTAETETLLGQPTEYEDIDNGFGEALKVAHYDELEMTFFFEGDDKTLNCIDIYNANATLFGEKILGRSEREVVSLLVANKYYEQDIETEAWGERRVSFGEGNIDLFFADNRLVSISIGK
jgi:hypothetical protein